MAKRTRNLSRKKKIAFYCIILLIPTTTISAIYIVYTGYRSRPLYAFVKSKRGWRPQVHKADPELGIAPIPDSQGAEVFPAGNDVPASYDKDGFRVPLEDDKRTSLNQHPIVLTLGDSFTYGVAVSAEDTYPYLVGHYLGGTARNAGVGSYGLAQMLILAKRLVPTYKPDYLVVQYTPWLVSRAQNPFAPAYFGKVPTPYFFVRQNELVLHPPIFRTKILDLPIDRYRDTPISVIDKVSFVWNVGLPLLVHDDFNMSYYNINRVLGRVPEPATNPVQITKYVYEEIAKVARENGAKLVIVVLGGDYSPVQIPEGSFPTDAIIVNAHDALLRHLPVANQETYKQAYAHWRGSPLRIVDEHLNETAHKIIAEAIVQKIQGEAEMQPNNLIKRSAGQRASGN